MPRGANWDRVSGYSNEQLSDMMTGNRSCPDGMDSMERRRTLCKECLKSNENCLMFDRPAVGPNPTSLGSCLGLR